MIINFDMDGTIANLYGDPDWLSKLRAHDAGPYMDATPLINFYEFACLLNELQRLGHQLAIISWLSKDPDPVYGEDVTDAKLDWLAQHLPSVKWDFIDIVPYGTPKGDFSFDPCDILFDDEAQNRENWPGVAYGVDNILNVLKGLIENG